MTKPFIPVTEPHAFDPGGRAHWDMPRCAQCREFSDHPLHPAVSITVHIAIGNSDGKLTQAEWSAFWGAVDACVRSWAVQVHGVWLSIPAAPYVNACWAIQVNEHSASRLRGALSGLARRYRQDSIAWLQGETVFIPAEAPAPGGRIAEHKRELHKKLYSAGDPAYGDPEPTLYFTQEQMTEWDTKPVHVCGSRDGRSGCVHPDHG